MLVLRSRLERACRVVEAQRDELEFRAEAYGSLLRKHHQLEEDYGSLEEEYRELKRSFPARDPRGRFVKR